MEKYCNVDFSFLSVQYLMFPDDFFDLIKYDAWIWKDFQSTQTVISMRLTWSVLWLSVRALFYLCNCKRKSAAEKSI